MGVYDARNRGFSLVELLIVILVIGVLAGMMMIAAGSATDGAEAARYVSDLRMAKSASLLLFINEGTWPTEANEATVRASLDRYADRAIFTGADRKYDLDVVEGSEDIGGGATKDRTILGIKPAEMQIHPSVLAKIKQSAQRSGVYFNDPPPPGFTSAQLDAGYVYMYLR
jgi:prepilin-type N-terminal cleavage/methylation domain-containing protein